MNVLFKNKYFRRECMRNTWTCTQAYSHGTLWYFDYISSCNNAKLLFMICENNDCHLVRKIDSRCICENLEHAVRLASESIGHLEIIQYLCTFDVNNQMDYNRFLRVCTHIGDVDMMRYYVDHKHADIDADIQHMLCWTSTKGHLDALRYLVEEKGADVHANNDITFAGASACGHLHIVQYLFENWNVNVNSHRRHALQYSATNGYLHVVRYLVEVCGVNPYHKLALKGCRKNGHLSVYQYLVNVIQQREQHE